MSIFLIFLNSVCYAGQSATGKQFAAKGGQATHFNIAKVFSAVVMFAIWILVQGNGLHPDTLPYAAAYTVAAIL